MGGFRGRGSVEKGGGENTDTTSSLSCAPRIVELEGGG